MQSRTTLENTLNHSELLVLLNSKEATAFLRINDGSSDGLRKSRSTGMLWGKPAPEFIKAGKKVLYTQNSLESFVAQFPRVSNNAQMLAIEPQG